jgi:dihydroorotase
VLIRNARLVNEGRELVAEQILPITTLVAKTSHRVADLFAIPDRGYLQEGYWADLVLIKPEPGGVAVSTQPIRSQCGWTPFARRSFRHSVSTADRVRTICLARQAS